MPTAILRTLPVASVNLGSTELWVAQNASRITVETLLLTVAPRVDILLVLLQRLRERVRSVKFVRTSKFRERSESSIRAEVDDNPSKFCFAYDALREYSPIHCGQMIMIVLALLEKQGVDARARHPEPKLTVV